MDWIRRNWPDLLIGIALMAVIAGIIATLLTGGSFFPLGQSSENSVRQEQSSATGRVAVTSPETSSRDEITTPGGTTGANRQGAAVAQVGAVDAGQTPRAVEVTALPLPGTPVASSVPETDERDGATSTAADSSRVSANETTAPAGVAVTASGRNAAAATSAADSGGVYRISVGAFSNEENAERQAALFRDAGYPVFTGVQGDLSIVLVGPYDDLGDAERVAARIRSGGFRIEPVIYRFRPDDAAAAAAGPTVSNQAAPVPASTAPAPQPTATAASGARYLQVGAYATAESAQPQRQRLEGLGFRVTARTEGKLVKLLVGPFAGDDLADARSVLDGQGIEHFPR
jgi:cell division septation protein DedD